MQFLQSLRDVRLDSLDLISRAELKELGTGRGGRHVPRRHIERLPSLDDLLVI